MKTWNTIPKGSKITLEKNTTFTGFEGDYPLKAGKYYIVGFWADVVGLSENRETIKTGMCDIHILSKDLKKFDLA